MTFINIAPVPLTHPLPLLRGRGDMEKLRDGCSFCATVLYPF